MMEDNRNPDGYPESGVSVVADREKRLVLIQVEYPPDVDPRENHLGMPPEAALEFALAVASCARALILNGLRETILPKAMLQ